MKHLVKEEGCHYGIDEEESRVEVAFPLLNALILGVGDHQANGKTETVIISMLKEIINSRFETFSWMSQDSSFFSRF